MLTRSVLDLLQEMISILWANHVQLIDENAEGRRRSRRLPATFSKLVLRDKRVARSAAEIENDFGLPRPLAEEYARVISFFCHLRDIRDALVHGGTGLGEIYVTEKGFCINPERRPFSAFSEWRPECYYNKNIASVLPWLANVILQTIQACNGLVTTFSTVIRLSPEIAPGYRVYVRGPHTEAIADLLKVHSGGSPGWVMKPQQLKAERFEGRIISQILGLSAKQCEYCYIRTKRELKTLLEQFESTRP